MQNGFFVVVGGPILQNNDGTLIGVMGFVNENVKESEPMKRIELQVFANIRYHFKWISSITGLELPQCQRSVRDEMFFYFYNIALMYNKRMGD